jgi:MFS family permease
VRVSSPAASEAQARPSFKRLIGGRDFRLLWAGEAVSLIGDQFQLIALPWLVVTLTGSPVAVGGVLAAAAFPRAVLMLVGGAVTDRYSPRLVMLASNLARFVLTAIFAAVLLTGRVELWIVYAYALAFGVADAFFFPAQTAIVPRVVQGDDLPLGNAAVQGTAQASLFVGPALAGALVALFAGGQGGAGQDVTGIGLAFAIDAATFLVSVATLALLRAQPSEESTAQQAQSLWRSIREGLVFVWHDPALRAIFGLLLAVNLLIVGPFTVGIPLLAEDRLQGAAAFGIIMSAQGGGSLAGILLAGALPPPPPRLFGSVLGLLCIVMGILFALISVGSTLAGVAALAAGTGLINGYIALLFITWLQRMTVPALQGRMMSLMMLASIGLVPVSQLIAGFLIRLSFGGVIAVAGAGMALLSLLMFAMPSVRAVGLRTGRLGEERETAGPPDAPAGVLQGGIAE